MIDIIATLPSALATGSDTPAPITLQGGGSAANTACWLASVGVDATLIARIGDDPLGRLAGEQLRASGVTAGVTIDGLSRTGSCIVLVHVDGERTMIPDAGANLGLAFADVDQSLFVAGRHLHLSAYSLFHSAQDAALRALELARSGGLSMSVDAASAAPLAEFGVDRFAEMIGTDLLLLANLDEAQVLTGSADAETAATRLAARHGRCVIKLGAAGALYSDGEQTVHVATSPLRAVDSTGAGDAFAAGLIAAQLTGAAPAECLSAGNQLAAAACGVRGGRPPALSE